MEKNRIIDVSDRRLPSNLEFIFEIEKDFENNGRYILVNILDYQEKSREMIYYEVLEELKHINPIYAKGIKSEIKEKIRFWKNQ